MSNVQLYLAVGVPVLVNAAMFALLVAYINAKFETINNRLDEMAKRLDRIEAKLDNHSERIAKLEERTSLVR